MDEILKIIIKCNKARKMFSVDDVKKICHIVLKNNKYDFIKKIGFAKKHPEKENCGGVFLGDSIYFFYEGIINSLTLYADKFTEAYGEAFDGATVDIFNYYYLTIIFHELAHARQHYLVINSKHSSPEKKLFTYSFNLESDRDYYEENYDNLITEVNANNVAHMTATYFYNKLPLNFISRTDKNVFRSEMMNVLLYGHYVIDPYQEVVESPAERIAYTLEDSRINSANIDIEEYAKLVLSNKFTLYKKLMLGLPISYLEYAYAKLLIDILPKSEDINVVKKLQKRIHE